MLGSGQEVNASGPADSQVYFIQASDGGPIKIGVTTNLRSRLKSLQTGHAVPVCVLLSLSGDEADERRLHARFAHLRMSGEWFRPEPELLSFIESVTSVANRHALGLET